jgi:hypothetical protein
MSLTPITTPPTWQLSHIPTDLVLSSNNLNQDPGTAAVHHLSVSAIPSGPNQTCLLQWNNFSLQLITKVAPDDSGLQLSTFFTGTAQQYALQVVQPFLQANAYLMNDFTLSIHSSATNLVVFALTARAPGAAFNLSITNAITGLAWATPTPGTDQLPHPNFSSYLELHISQVSLSPSYLKATASQSHLGAQARFPLAQILSAHHYGPALPPFGGTGIYSISQAIIQYYYRYAEAYGSPKAIRALSAPSALCYAIQGGFDKDKYTTTTFAAQLAAQGTILTHRPLGGYQHRVSRTQQHFLSYLHTDVAMRFRIYGTIWYTDGSSTNITLHTVDGVITTPSLWVFACGYNAISGFVNPAKVVDFWSLYAGSWSDADEAYSKTHFMRLDARQPIEETQILFANSFGCFEVFRATGTVALGVQPISTQAQRHLPAGSHPTEAATVAATAPTVRRRWEVNTGFLTRSEIERAVDMLRSPEHFLVTPTHFRPVVLVANEKELAASRSGRANSFSLTILEDTDSSHV